MNDPRVEELRALLPRCLLADWVRLGSRLVRLLRDTRHPGHHDELLGRLLARARESAELRELRRAAVPVPTYPDNLPITARRPEIVDAIRRHQVVVLAGETGSGKTTQIPKMCLEAGLGIEAMIGCTQPRRVAALSISRRIAEELGVPWGREVGCRIRFDDRTGPETFIKLMTDGILLAETQGDPLLSHYNALILDEAHERSLNIDFLLGYLKGLLPRRSDLKLIVTSATIDTAAFSRAFDDAPVIEVSGRTYPVEVRYDPVDPEAEERGDVTCIDAAVRATLRVLDAPGGGDVLVFLPGERDIREAVDLLDGRTGPGVEVIPLFGRLSAGDQQRVFTPTERRRVIVATNIAETSLTLPGIRFVVDAGLARISRYNPRTRTRRLPVEPVSQGSANQRKGRAGRVQEGICIRLYSEEDFNARPANTQPEIQRANLAEVILRMKAFRLGDIATFPFLDPPSPSAIQAGYALLQELGALDADRELTPLGRDLARLPIDPALGRMLLQAQAEKAVPELLVIAAGLSIQDPRERPLDRRAAADAAHRQHVDPRSDFLTLLNVWNAVHAQWTGLRTQNQRRRFCRDHFLSYTRMREWQDLHAQLGDALDALGPAAPDGSRADYEAIHRAVLSGLLGHVAVREERNVYKSTGNRQVLVFPGSVLHERAEPNRGGRRKPSEPAPNPREKSRQPAWVVAGEIVETSQVFARTLAGIDPAWIPALAPHLCKVTHQNPHWSPEAGRVLVEERTLFQGLEVAHRRVAYGRIDPDDATTLFIRAALVEDNLLPPEPGDPDDDGPPPPGTRRAGGGRIRTPSGVPAPGSGPDPFPFLAHNRALREKIETWQTRVRRHDLSVDTALFRFYSARLAGVSSRDELRRKVAEAGPGFLCATEADVTGGRDLSIDTGAFPDRVDLDGQPAGVRYAYAPGEEHDGVTVRLPAEAAAGVAPARLEWSVPALREALVEEYLRSLPKSLRRQLQPVPPKVAEIVRDLAPVGPTLAHDLATFLHRRHGIPVAPADFDPASIPAHLRVRTELLGPRGETVGHGRDLEALRRQVATAPPPTAARPAGEPPAWQAARRRWEQVDLGGWSVGDLPERVDVPLPDGTVEPAWPGLLLEEGHVHLRLFRSAAAARAAGGFAHLVERAVGRELAWLEKDLRDLRRFEALCAPVAASADLARSALAGLRRSILPALAPSPLTAAAFQQAVDAARARLQGLGVRAVDGIRGVLQARADAAGRMPPAAAPTGPAAGRRTLTDLSQLDALVRTPPRPAPAPAAAVPAGDLTAELTALVPTDFPERVPMDRWPDVVRHLKGLGIRAERARLNPAKDRERAARVVPYLALRRELAPAHATGPVGRGLRDEFHWLVEEFKISVFAQELGTRVPVSERRLDELAHRIRTTAG